ncbi:MAG: hypothetical protein ACRD5Z_07365 [Bryobacteraceae bacterium]
MAVAAAMTATSQATPITFTFGNNNGGGESQAVLDGMSAGTVTVGGLTLTAAANTGTFNSTSMAGFGINATASGDSTTEFDATDVMTFSFDQAVTLTLIDLNVFGPGDSGFITHGASTVHFTGDPFTTSISLAANESVTFGNDPGSSFSLQSITVDLPTGSVPENAQPTVCLLLGVGLILGGERFLRRKAA